MKKSSVYGQSFAGFSTRLKGGDNNKRKREDPAKEVEDSESEEGDLENDLRDNFEPSSEEEEKYRKKGKGRQKVSSLDHDNDQARAHACQSGPPHGPTSRSCHVLLWPCVKGEEEC